MTYRGHVENGHVVLDDSIPLPDGTQVEVVVRRSEAQHTSDEAPIPTLYERLKPIIGTACGLPADAAKNVDHYLYGHPKQ